MSKKNYTTFDIARICDVQPATVAYWIEQKQLKAYKTPGGHRRVTPDHLYEFLNEHDMPIPDYLLQNHRPRVLIVANGDNGGSTPAKALEKSINGDYEVKLARDFFQTGMLMASFKPQCVVLYLEAAVDQTIDLCQELQSAADNGNLTILMVVEDVSAPLNEAVQRVGVRQCLSSDTPVGELHKIISACLN